MEQVIHLPHEFEVFDDLLVALQQDRIHPATSIRRWLHRICPRTQEVSGTGHKESASSHYEAAEINILCPKNDGKPIPGLQHSRCHNLWDSDDRFRGRVPP